MKRICVFCGSSTGNNSKYIETARTLGLLLVDEDIELVYGGGSVGLMGKIAETVMQNGGRVTGIIPQDLARTEMANRNVTDLRLVKTMHERKAMMFDLSDAFIAMPGGVGTLEEFSEMVTWAQLGLHRKPCGLLNIERYYQHLIAFLDHAVAELFLKPAHRKLILIEEDPRLLLKRFRQYRPPEKISRLKSRFD